MDRDESTFLPSGDSVRQLNLVMTAEQRPGDLLDLSSCSLWKPPKGIYFKASQLLKCKIDFSNNHLITIFDDLRKIDRYIIQNMSTHIN